MSEQPEIRQRLQALRDKLTPKLGVGAPMAGPSDIIELIDCVWELNNPNRKPSITINNSGACAAAKTGLDIANNAIKEAAKDATRATHGLTTSINAAWEQRIADGLVKPGQHPKLPNMAGPRPSYFRRVWNALRGR